MEHLNFYSKLTNSPTWSDARNELPPGSVMPGNLQDSPPLKDWSTPSQAVNCQVKVLVPPSLLNIIQISMIPQAHFSSIQSKLGEDEVFFPGTKDRVLTLESKTYSEIAELICSHLQYFRISHNSYRVSIRLPVPRWAVGNIIGTGGETIKRIRESTGAVIHISSLFVTKASVSEERLISISSGFTAKVKNAVRVILELIHTNDNVWFPHNGGFFEPPPGLGYHHYCSKQGDGFWRNKYSPPLEKLSSETESYYDESNYHTKSKVCSNQRLFESLGGSLRVMVLLFLALLLTF